MYQLNKMKTEQQLHANIKARSLGDRKLIVDNRNVNWTLKFLIAYWKEKVRFNDRLKQDENHKIIES